MPQKRRNPLSDARKSDNFYQDLWHKKTGLGYRLLVEYYGQQPAGIVVEATTARTSTKEQPLRVDPPGGGGMSRAAKRRRKKNKTLEDTSGMRGTKEPQSSSQEPPSEIATTSPLVRALHETSQHHHLTDFVNALSEPLPLTFRLRHVSSSSDSRFKDKSALADRLDTEYADLVTTVGNDIYQAKHNSLSKFSLAKVSPSLRDLLVEKSTTGVLARQELGSMLPVIGLVQSGVLKSTTTVLDTCASPGSKTLQVLEQGVSRVIANDVHSGRLQTLQDAVLRSGVPDTEKQRCQYTNVDACHLKLNKPVDVVVADVPCTGDGTIRKDPIAAKTWRPAAARALHSLQVQILQRAVDLVAEGGVVSYSTCSLNPIENEAVVQAVLSASSSVDLIDWPDLDGIVLRPGVSDWKILDCETKESDDEKETWVEYATHTVATAAGMAQCAPTMWPTKNKGLKLHHCRRLWPQDQDSGGFFVALLRKGNTRGGSSASKAKKKTTPMPK